MKSFGDVLNGRTKTGKGCFVLASILPPQTNHPISTQKKQGTRVPETGFGKQYKCCADQGLLERIKLTLYTFEITVILKGVLAQGRLVTVALTPQQELPAVPSCQQQQALCQHCPPKPLPAISQCVRSDYMTTPFIHWYSARVKDPSRSQQYCYCTDKPTLCSAFYCINCLDSGAQAHCVSKPHGSYIGGWGGTFWPIQGGVGITEIVSIGQLVSCFRNILNYNIIRCSMLYEWKKAGFVLNIVRALQNCQNGSLQFSLIYILQIVMLYGHVHFLLAERDIYTH